MGEWTAWKELWREERERVTQFRVCPLTTAFVSSLLAVTFFHFLSLSFTFYSPLNLVPFRCYFFISHSDTLLWADEVRCSSISINQRTRCGGERGVTFVFSSTSSSSECYLTLLAYLFMRGCSSNVTTVFCNNFTVVIFFLFFIQIYASMKHFFLLPATVSFFVFTA